MRTRAPRLAAILVVSILVPPILATNVVRAVAAAWYVRFEYGRDGFPPDRYGLTRAQRTDLAITGLHSILPRYDRGMEELRRARLPSGRPAFGEREVRHMRDVRRVLDVLYPAHLAAIAAVAALAALLGLRPATRTVVARGLAGGAGLTLALAAGTAVLVRASYDTFERVFHGLFFDEGTWRFADETTLRRLYPDRFWSDTAVAIGGGAAAQAVLLLGLALLWARQANSRAERRRGG